MAEWPEPVMEYEEWQQSSRDDHTLLARPPRHIADAAIRRLEEMVRKRDKMLEEAWRCSGQAWSWPKDEWLDYIALRVEGREYRGDDD